jgi:hypothetical protein
VTRRFGIALAAALVVSAAPATAAVRIDGPPGEQLAEADLAIRPTDPQRVLVVAKDRDGGIPIHDLFRSSDGGSSFTGGEFFPGSFYPEADPVSGSAAAATDPVIAFDGRGVAYFASLADIGSDSVIAVQRSTDGGATFSKPVEVIRTRGGGFNAGRHTSATVAQSSAQDDKEWLAIDRSGGPRDGSVYVIWQQNRPVNGGAGVGNQVLFSSSSDGVRFTRPKRLTSSKIGAVGAQVAVRPDGRLVATWFTGSGLQPGAKATVVATSSDDGGKTFSAPRTIGKTVRVAGDCEACLLSSVETSGDGTALACFPRSRGSSRSSGAEALCARSSDGRKFSSPVRIAPSVAGSHDLITVAAQGKRRFWVLFVARGTKNASVQLFRSDDAGRSFRRQSVLATRAYRLPEVPSIGDYMGLDASGDGVLAAYVLPRAGRGSANSLYVESVAAP